MTDAVEQMKNMVFEVMDKYAFIEEYINQPSVLIGRQMPIFVKYMSTILYLRRRLGFLLIPEDEVFYDNIEDNDYTKFVFIDDIGYVKDSDIEIEKIGFTNMYSVKADMLKTNINYGTKYGNSYSGSDYPAVGDGDGGITDIPQIITDGTNFIKS